MTKKYNPHPGSLLQDKSDISVPFRESEFFKKFGHEAGPGNNMRTYRLLAGLTQTQLGQRLGGIPRSHISAFESESRPIGKELAKKLAKLFGVSVEMFL
ncbi:helix-turn-helix transcriptional regulator [Leptospira santarosai]|uniref:helix-turn-helix transcriptional regulator n=1 Tax=Leptospira santarosai TaxID=28183 RepID=UPI0002B9A035|nr:helix-turn-helix transcriptional regulator [Leptospira santarosai]EMF89798.1 DNA-binding helix-turn-helix protein [Leptospira santarosai str. ST188]MDI7165297.1 helix-turn-helix transcriptional regulator [Leptospira santarosai]MDO6384458.1 helix-turn-helix transcriptional regulator [Leptospira santarosai]